MPADPRRRQRKLEKQKAKRKAERREIARREARGHAGRLEEASTSPVLHCCATESTWSQGMGEVLLSRELSNGNVAFGAFLIDRYCLGVKNAFFGFGPRNRYERTIYDKLVRQDELVVLTPQCARKLVEGAVRYALDLGFSPHADYRTAKMIFGDIRAEECTEEFEYGKDGKPLFIAGPNDSPARCDAIINTLHERLGPDGYHFIVPADGSTLVTPREDDEEDEDDGEPDELGPPDVG